MHASDYEHKVYVLGEVRNEEQSSPIKQGSVVFIPPTEVHQFKNMVMMTLSFFA